MTTSTPLTTSGQPESMVVRLDPAAEAYAFMGPRVSFERVAVLDVALREGEALVEVELATVCGSDLHTSSGARPGPTPSILGHEQVGRVIALGPGEPPRDLDGLALAPGMRIVWGIAVDCGDCRTCRRGIPNKCEHLRKYGHEQIRGSWQLNGGIATHVHLLARTPIVQVSDHLPAAVLAPASCATATVAAVLSSAEETRPVGGEVILVSGCGMLGLTAIAMANSRGATVVATDPLAERRALAIEFGAAAAVPPDVDQAHRALAALGVPGFGAGLDLSGANAAIELLLQTADVGATIVLAGSVFPAPPVSVSAESIVRRLLTLRGVHNYRPEHLVQAVRFLEGAPHELFAALVGEVVPFDDAPRALTTPPATGARVGIRPTGRTDVR